MGLCTKHPRKSLFLLLWFWVRTPKSKNKISSLHLCGQALATLRAGTYETGFLGREYFGDTCDHIVTGFMNILPPREFER